MATITTRSGKGSPLTNNEVDANFTNLNTDKAELSGATFTGEIVANAGIALGDNDKATFGASDDLQIYHDGTHSYIKEAGTGNLNILANDLRIRNAAGNEDMLQVNQDGDVKISYDGSTKLATTSTGITVTGTVVATSLDISGNIDVDGITNLDVVDIDGAVDMASTLAVGGVVTANAGVVVDNFTLDGTTLALSSGDMLIDVAGSIILDADGGSLVFRDSGTTIAQFDNASSNLQIISMVQDKDIVLRGNDGGSFVNALTLDMSDAGTATFNHDILLADDSKIRLGSSQDFFIYHTPSLNAIQAATADQDIVFYGNDGGTTITALTLDMSDGGNAIFNKDIFLSDNSAARFGTGQDLAIFHDGNNSTIRNTTGNLTLDVAGDIILDADGGDIRLHDAGVLFGKFTQYQTDFYIDASVSDRDMIFRGIDSGIQFVALTLDMSAAGQATFNSTVTSTGLTANVPTLKGLIINSADVSVIQFNVAHGGQKNWGFASTYLAAGDFGLYQSNSNGGDPITAGAAKLYFNAAGAATFSSTVSVAGVGVIGATDGDLNIFSTASGHGGLRFGNTHISPTNNSGIITNDVMSLGLSGARFTNLYLTDSVQNSGKAGSATIFNEDGTTADFRVESNNNANMLFVDGGNNRVGIGTAAPIGNFNINGGTGDTATQDAIQTFTRTSSTGNVLAAKIRLDNSSTAHADLKFQVKTTASSAESDSYYTDALTLGGVTGSFVTTPVAGGHTVFNEDGVDADFRVESDNDTHALFVDGLTGNVYGSKTGSSMTTAGWGLARNGGSEFVSQGNNITPLKVASADDAYISLIEFFTNNGTQAGYILGNGSALSLVSNSDYRLKEDWKPIENATETFMQLKPCNFAWKADGSRTDGFLAHELQEVVPNAAHGEKDAVDSDGNPKYQGIDQSNLVPLLTAALQEALTKIETLETRLTALENA